MPLTLLPAIAPTGLGALAGRHLRSWIAGRVFNLMRTLSALSDTLSKATSRTWLSCSSPGPLDYPGQCSSDVRPTSCLRQVYTLAPVGTKLVIISWLFVTFGEK